MEWRHTKLGECEAYKTWDFPGALDIMSRSNMEVATLTYEATKNPSPNWGVALSHLKKENCIVS